MRNIDDKGVVALAAAVIEQAVTDYKDGRKLEILADRYKQSVLNFIYDEHFYVFGGIINIDPEVIERVIKMIEDEPREVKLRRYYLMDKKTRRKYGPFVGYKTLKRILAEYKKEDAADGLHRQYEIVEFKEDGKD